MVLVRSLGRFPSMSRRTFASDSSTPLMWKLAHGMFDPETSMTEKMPGIEQPIEIEAMKPTDPKTTVLSNGVRVISQDLGGSVTSLALFVGAGSRNENPYTSGTSFMLERLAFKGNDEVSKYRMIRDMERTGAIYNAASSRETIAYAAEGLRTKVDDILSNISNSVKFPISDLPSQSSPSYDTIMDEINTQRSVIKSDLQNIKKDPNNILNESIHNVAFHGNTLGLALIPTEEKLDAIVPETIHEYASEHFTPDRMVLSASNYDHEKLVELAEKQLGEIVGKKSDSKEESKYTGGGIKISNNGPGHIAIGFKGISWQDKDLVPICILHTLLGGGGSFSSGGPGKGMYTRLYSQVLNQQAWVTQAIAFNHCYSDNGLFGIQASCEDTSQLNALIEIIGLQISKINQPLNQDELIRAKAMTKSSLIMNLESRAVVCEDLGRQLLSSDIYTGPDQLIEHIDKINEDDIRRVASRILDSTPSIVTYGEEYATQDYSAIESAIKSQVKLSA